jgi:hypothetical protein
MNCKNCDNEFVGNYCNACGQKVVNRLTLKSIWALVVDDVFEVDKGLLYTIKSLTINPGKTSLDYINGRTKRYYSPLKYLIFWTALFFILTSLFPLVRETQSTNDIIINSTKPFSPESLPDFVVSFSEMMFSHIDLFYLGLVPFLSLLSYVVYRKRNKNFAELSIMYLYILGHIILIIAMAFPIISLFDNKNDTALFVFMFPLAAFILYMVIVSHRQFFGDSWVKSIVKGIVIFYGGQFVYWFTIYLILNLLKVLN